MPLTLDEKISLLQEVGEEIIDLDELRELIQWKADHNEEIYAYDGFEPSGVLHIGQGLLRAINVNKITKAGIKLNGEAGFYFGIGGGIGVGKIQSNMYPISAYIGPSPYVAIDPDPSERTSLFGKRDIIKDMDYVEPYYKKYTSDYHPDKKTEIYTKKER